MSTVVLYTQPGVPNGDLVTMYLAVRSVFNPSKPSVFHGAHICADVYTHPLLPPTSKETGLGKYVDVKIAAIGRDGDMRSPAGLKMNPLGEVPVLQKLVLINSYYYCIYYTFPSLCSTLTSYVYFNSASNTLSRLTLQRVQFGVRFTNIQATIPMAHPCVYVRVYMYL